MMFTSGYNPSAWYWRATDGRIASSASGSLIAESDGTYQDWLASGQLPTPWPADPSGQQTVASLDEVLAPFGIAIGTDPLVRVRAALCAELDGRAEEQRLRHITAGSGKALVYAQKQGQAAQALAGLAASPPMTAAQGATNFVLLAAGVGVTIDPQSNQPAADVFGVARAVAAAVAAWLPIAAAIERAAALGKAAIRAATTAEAAQAALDAVTWPPG